MKAKTDLSTFNRKEKKGIFEKSSEKSGNNPTKTVGRPRKEEVDRKSEQVTVYCTKAEFRMLEKLREESIAVDMPMGAFVHRLLARHIFIGGGKP